MCLLDRPSPQCVRVEENTLERVEGPIDVTPAIDVPNNVALSPLKCTGLQCVVGTGLSTPLPLRLDALWFQSPETLNLKRACAQVMEDVHAASYHGHAIVRMVDGFVSPAFSAYIFIWWLIFFVQVSNFHGTTFETLVPSSDFQEGDPHFVTREGALIERAMVDFSRHVHATILHTEKTVDQCDELALRSYQGGDEDPLIAITCRWVSGKGRILHEIQRETDSLIVSNRLLSASLKRLN